MICFTRVRFGGPLVRLDAIVPSDAKAVETILVKQIAIWAAWWPFAIGCDCGAAVAVKSYTWGNGNLPLGWSFATLD
jgi:hypothetical protein